MLEQINYAADAGRIAKLQKDIRLGALSVSALVEHCLSRIDAIDPVVQAWRYVAHDSARAEADLLDREAKAGRFRGPLHGIPVGIKDIIDVAGVTTLANSKLRVDSAPATADAEIVAALRLAGAVIIGKTHTTEFAYFDPSPAAQHRPHTRRLIERIGCCGGRRQRTAGGWHSNGRLGQSASCVLRRRSFQAEHPVNLHPRHHAAGACL